MKDGCALLFEQRRHIYCLPPPGAMCRNLTAVQVYDITLSAALKLQKCGPNRLVVEGEWKWLLGMFAASYGICQSYTTLAHLRWVIK